MYGSGVVWIVYGQVLHNNITLGGGAVAQDSAVSRQWRCSRNRASSRAAAIAHRNDHLFEARDNGSRTKVSKVGDTIALGATDGDCQAWRLAGNRARLVDMGCH